MNDLHNNVRVVHALAPAAAGTTGTGRSSDILDRQGWGGVEFGIHYGAATTTGYSVAITVLEGDTTGAMTSVADADLLGTEVLAGLAAQATARTSGTGLNVGKRIGYRGDQRYVQIKEVPAAAATGIVGITAILHNPNNAPTSNP